MWFKNDCDRELERQQDQERYDKEFNRLTEILAKVPEEHRWKFHIVPEVVYGTCASYITPMPIIENWADPKPVVNISRYGGSDGGLGALGAGAVGFALGSMLDGD